MLHERKPPNCKEENGDGKSEFLKVQLKFINIGGIFPPKSVYGSRWKIVLYNIYAAIILIWYGPSVTSQIVAFYQNWGSVVDITAIIFETVAGVNNVLITSYLLMNRHKIKHVISKVEDGFKTNIDSLPFCEKHLRILAHAAKQNNKFSWMIIITNSISTILWTVVPFMLWYTYNGVDIYDTSENQRVHWEFFCYKTWHPANSYQSPMYQLVWGYQLIPIWSIYWNFTGYNMFFYSLVTFTAAHFRILNDFIQNVNTLLENNAESDLDIDRMLESMTNCEENNVSAVCMESALQVKSDIENTEKLNLNSKDIQKGDEVEYMTKCIEYHQAILEFCNDIENLFSPLFLILFFTNGAMMCTTAFQATLRSEEQSYVKFFMVSVSCWAPIFLACWFGEQVTQQSLRVEQAAYGCNWFNTTTRFKKLLRFIIMRSQKPVILTGGGMFTVNLKGFADIANNVYAYFTVLQKMQAED